MPPTGLWLSEDLDTTYSFIFTEYDQDLRALGGGYEGRKSPQEDLNKNRFGNNEERGKQ